MLNQRTSGFSLQEEDIFTFVLELEYLFFSDSFSFLAKLKF
uniref:Uncharacterized protein n=1 Tax=Arundo donax TaxID=35708 RepID=A0A0A8ZLA9_ARUDO